MKKRYLSSLIFILLLGACSPIHEDNINPINPSLDGDKPYETPYNDEGFIEFFNPSNKVEILLDFSNYSKSLYNLAQYGVSDFTKKEMYHPCDVTVTINENNYQYNLSGVRMKGNTSRYSYFVNENEYIVDKNTMCHFKINFAYLFNDETQNDYFTQTYTDDEAKIIDKRRMCAMKKIDLKWNKNYDSSFTKELYALQMFREEGVLSQHATLVMLTIKTCNDSVSKQYLAYEAVDKQLLKKAFSKDYEGDLYKCTYNSVGPADMTNTESIGVESAYFSPIYDLKTNENKSDFSLLYQLINNTRTRNTSAKDMKEIIDGLIDVDNFLKFSALSWIVGSPDDLRNNYNNYYIYFNSKNNLAYFLPYDNDRVFGILKDWPIDTSTMKKDSDRLEGTASGNGCGVPLIRRLIVPGSTTRPIIEEYYEKYCEYCVEYANKYLDGSKFEKYTNQFYYSSKDITGGSDNMSFSTYANSKLATL